MRRILFLLFFITLFLSTIYLDSENAKAFSIIFNEETLYNCPYNEFVAGNEFTIDNESVEIIDDNFFKDKNQVYYTSTDHKARKCITEALNEVDPNSFQIINEQYQKDKNNIFYITTLSSEESSRRILQTLEGANIDLFELINDYYAKDNNKGYFCNLYDFKTIENVDIESFEQYTKNNKYAKDKYYFYYKGEKISDKELDQQELIYMFDNKIIYQCPDGPISPPQDFNVDIDSVKIINNRFFTDKNNVYHMAVDSHSYSCTWQKLDKIDATSFVFLNNYYQKDKNYIYHSDNYWGWLQPDKTELDIDTFQILNENYAKDKNGVYYTVNNNFKIINGADADTFETLKEDGQYAIDKNDMYYTGTILNEAAEKITNNSLYKNLKGKIILKVEDSGEAYYVHPNKQEMHFLSRPVVAFYVMREQGIGISNSNLEKIPVADNYCPSYTPDCDNSNTHDINFTKEQVGKIYLQVEENGEAWYVNPSDNKRYFLGRPTDAFNVMKNLGLGISNNDFNKL